MSERSYAVRLSARVDSYVAAMRQAEKATTQFSTESQRNLKKVGGQLQNVGGDLTRKVTVPLTGLGVAAIKMSTDFDTAFAQMVGLADVPADEVDRLKQSVLDLAGDTAVAPQELADALYFAASAGLDSAGAMKAVEAAARASAAGLGRTQDVVGLAASAIASYGAENITAAEATDILTATIRAGRAEPAELAGVLGRVLPIASQLGVSFDEVGGTVAFLSNVFGDTNRTVTATQGLLVKLVAPTQQGRDALAEMGTSVEELHAAVDQRGLLGALDLLRERGFAGNTQALRALFDDIEGYQAALALLNGDQQALTETMQETATAAGAADEAFGAVSETAGFEMKQAWVDLQTALIEVGDIIAPIVANIASGVGDLVSAFESLPGPVQTSIVVLGTMAAAAGPVVWTTGTVIKNLQQMRTTMVAMKASAGLIATGLGAVGLAAGAAAATYLLVKARTESVTDAMDAQKRKMDELRQSAADLVDELRGLDNPSDALRTRFVGLADESDLFIRTLSGMGLTIDELVTKSERGGQATGGLAHEIRRGAIAAGASREEADELADQVGELIYVWRMSVGVLGEVNEVTDDSTVSLEEQAAQAELDAEAQAALQAQIERTAEAQRVNAERTDRAREAHARYVEAVLSSLSGLFTHEQSVLRTENAYMDLQEAIWNNALTQADAEVSDRDKAESANNLRLKELALAEQIYDTAGAYAEEAGAVEGSKEWVDLMIESLKAQAEQYPEMRDEIDLYIAKLGEIPTMIHTGVTVTYTTNGRGPVTINTGPNSGTISTSGKRATGGSTRAGHAYEVLEEGRSELLTEGGRTFLMAARDGYVTPLSAIPTSPAPRSDPAGDGGGDRIGVKIDHFHDESGHSLDDVFRTANALLAMGV